MVNINEVIWAFVSGSSLTPVLVLLLLLAWLWLRYHAVSPPPRGRPLPGPKGIPFLGYLPFLRPRLYMAMERLQRQYGDIIALSVGMQRFVFLNSYDAIREALVVQGDVFAGRFKFELVRKSNRDSGIIFTDGPKWKEHRRFALRVLKDFGLGRSLAEDIILHEAELLREHLEAQSGTAQDTKTLFCRSVSNVISTMEFGDRSGHEDPGFDELMERIDKMLSAGGFATLLPVIFPFVNRYQWLYTPFEWFLRLWEHAEWAHDFIRRKIEEHQNRLSLSGASSSVEEAQDFCDALLLEQRRLEITGKPHTFTEWQLIRTLFELFIAGTDTTAVTLCWAWVLLALYPDVQTAVHEELDRVVGRQRQPRMADKRQCHFVSAVLDEVLRLSTIAPFALPHRSTEDSVVNGIFIPKDSLIMPTSTPSTMTRACGTRRRSSDPSASSTPRQTPIKRQSTW